MNSYELVAVDVVDEDLWAATHSNAAVMITSRCQDERLRWARRIHLESRGDAPLVEINCRTWQVTGGDRHLPTRRNRERLEDIRSSFRRSATGTVFLDCIEAMSRSRQAELQLLLDDTVQAGPTSLAGGAPRVISGATGSLLTAIRVGAFAESLFYRLNVIHFDLTDRLREVDSLPGPRPRR